MYLKKMRLPLLAFLGVAFALSTTAGAAPAANAPRVFRAGAATSNVTPPLGGSMHGSKQDKTSKHVHDELHARCLVLDDGETKLALVVVDNCLIPRELFDSAKRQASEITGIPVTHMMMSATHTHTSPTTTPAFDSRPDPAYVDFLARRIADGVRRANHLLVPARIGWGKGHESTTVFNRRWFVTGGAPNPFGGRDQVKMNPLGYPATKSSGPIDPEVSVISVQALSGRPISVFANFSLHYVGGVQGGDVSADYYGMFADRVKELLKVDHQDPAFVAMMSNGTSGNINNVNSAVPRSTSPPYQKMRQVAHLLADEVIRVRSEIRYQDWVDLDSAQKEITLGVRRPQPEEIERARDIRAKEKKKGVRTEDEVYARETLDMSKYPATVSLIIQAFKIGELAINAIPCETFVEIGLELKKRSPFPTTFTVSLANGYNGYLPTPEHHALGGYETWRAKSSYLEIPASPKVVATAMELLGELRAK